MQRTNRLFLLALYYAAMNALVCSRFHCFRACGAVATTPMHATTKTTVKARTPM